MDSRTVIKLLNDAGWKHVAVRGSHHKFEHPQTNRHVVVPHPRKDLTIGVLKSIERHTGLKLR